MDPRLQTGIIAAIITLVGIVLKDYALTLLQERRHRRQSVLSVYRSYADPLTSAASHLLWRLNEIFFKESYYLKPEGQPTDFERYKQISTLYRLASLLGWIQAYRRELTFLPEPAPGKLKPLRDAITKFETALADGSDVELQRLESLAALWALTLPTDKQVKARVANTLEKVLKRLLHSAGVSLAKDLGEENQTHLCSKVRDVLVSELKSAPISDAVVQKTKAGAIQSLSIRESWLYRDFQAAIGDVMIQESHSQVRRFDVLGYRAFEAMVYEGSNEDRRWLRRLTNTIEDLDISHADQFDARVELLRNTLRATAELVLVLATIEKRRSSVSTKTLEVCDKVLSSVRAADDRK